MSPGRGLPTTIACPPAFGAASPWMGSSVSPGQILLLLAAALGKAFRSDSLYVSFMPLMFTIQKPGKQTYLTPVIPSFPKLEMSSYRPGGPPPARPYRPVPAQARHDFYDERRSRSRSRERRYSSPYRRQSPPHGKHID
jgi:hypothetical protein